jgi:hypothetical protein
VWQSIEAIVPRRQLRESVDAVSDVVPPPGADDDAEMRARLTERIAMVTPFGVSVRLLSPGTRDCVEPGQEYLLRAG